MANKPRRIKPISKSDLARLAGCSRQLVNYQAKGALSVALLPGGDFDSEHPAVREWVSLVKLRSAQTPTPTPEPAAAAPSVPTPKRKPGRPALQLPTETGPTELVTVDFPDDGTPDAIDRVLDLPTQGNLIRLREYDPESVTNKEALGWADLKKRLEEVLKLRLDNEETKGKVIHRDGGITHTLGLVDLVFNRLLGDVLDTLISVISSASKSGSPAEEIKRTGYDIMSGALRDLKTTAIRRLLNPDP